MDIQLAVSLVVGVAFLDECRLVFPASFQQLKDEEIGSFSNELTEWYRLTRSHQARDSRPAKSFHDLSLPLLKEALSHSSDLFSDDDSAAGSASRSVLLGWTR